MTHTQDERAFRDEAAMRAMVAIYERYTRANADISILDIAARAFAMANAMLIQRRTDEEAA